MRNAQMVVVLKRLSLVMGIILLAISMFFSYDGFDSSAGNGENYATLAKVIGWCIAIAVSVIQFVFSTDYKGLNWTLRLVGVVSYIYSIWSNKLGIAHTLLMPETNSWVVSVFMDVVPEPLIAWSLGEALSGDVVGNIGQMLFGANEKAPAHNGKKKKHYQTSKSTYVPKHKPQHLQRNHSKPVYNDDMESLRGVFE